MIIAAAVASPKHFARMVAAAHELSSPITAGSFSIAVLADRIQNAHRFCKISVNRRSLAFYTLEPMSLYGANRRTPGVYAISYSLTRLCVERNELVKPYPALEEPRD